MSDTPVRSSWRNAAFAFLLAIGLARPAHAQGVSPRIPDSPAPAAERSPPLMQASPVWAPAAASTTAQALDTTTARPETHWATGAIIGGAALGLFTGWFTAGRCSESDSGTHDCVPSAIGGFLMGAAVGGALGAFIGARFTKHPQPAAAASGSE